MRFNVKRTQVKIIQVGGEFYVEHWGGLEPLIQYTRKPLTLEQIKAVFDPADCVALDLVEPDRNKNLQQIGQKDPNMYRGE